MISSRGTKDEFLNDPEVVCFGGWLTKVICGTVTINYMATSDTQFGTLSEAKKAYQWPPKKKVIPLPTGAPVILQARANLAANEVVLDQLSAGLRVALHASPTNHAVIAAWVKAIFVWGGVYTKRGNAAWLTGISGHVGTYLPRTLKVLGSVLREQDIDHLLDLRSNAGTTKVHSLALPAFIIYDSRVAAALSWLVVRWACETERTAVPVKLQFGCMRPNTSDRNKLRTPAKRIFPYFSPVANNLNSQRRHARWNLRANWLLYRSLAQAQRTCGKNEFASLRDVEAALFVMGADLSHALPNYQACIERLNANQKTERNVKTYRSDELEPVLSNVIT